MRQDHDDGGGDEVHWSDTNWEEGSSRAAEEIYLGDDPPGVVADRGRCRNTTVKSRATEDGGPVNRLSPLLPPDASPPPPLRRLFRLLFASL